MTRRPPPRRSARRRRTVDALLAVTATLALTSIMAAGNAVAPRPRVEQTPDLPAAADRTERTRACRCTPRQPITEEQTRWSEPADAVAGGRAWSRPTAVLAMPTSAPSAASTATGAPGTVRTPQESPHEQAGVRSRTSPEPSGIPGSSPPTESTPSTPSASPTPLPTTTPPETTEPTPTSTTTETTPTTTEPTETTATETTEEVP